MTKFSIIALLFALFIYFCRIDSLPLSRVKATTDDRRINDNGNIVNAGKTKYLIKTFPPATTIPANKYYNDIDVDEKTFPSIENVILKEAKTLFNKHVPQLLNKDGPALRKELYQDRTQVGNMPSKAFVIKVIAPLRKMASGLNLDFNGQCQHRIRMERHLLELITRHEKVCILLRKKRNGDARYIFNLEENHHHTNTGSLLERQSAAIQKITDSGDNHGDILPSIATTIYHQQQRSPTLTMQSAVTKASPMEVIIKKKASPFIKVRRMIHHDLVAYKGQKFCLLWIPRI